MSEQKESNRLTVIVDDELFEKIENYRFEKRFQTRKEAITDLLIKGIDALLEEQNSKGESNK